MRMRRPLSPRAFRVAAAPIVTDHRPTDQGSSPSRADAPSPGPRHPRTVTGLRRSATAFWVGAWQTARAFSALPEVPEELQRRAELARHSVQREVGEPDALVVKVSGTTPHKASRERVSRSERPPKSLAPSTEH